MANLTHQPVKLLLATFAIGAHVLFLSCTSGGGGESRSEGRVTPTRKPVDGEGIQGQHERAFYNTRNTTNASVIITAGAGQPARKYEYQSGSVTLVSQIQPQLVSLSRNQTVITVMNDPGIYEFSPIPLPSIVAGTAALPEATLESYCKPLPEAGYDEFQIKAREWIDAMQYLHGDKAQAEKSLL